MSEQKARERISNLFLSLSSVRKKNVTPCQELEPYVPQGICRLDKKSGKLYPLRPTAYLVEVASRHTIDACIKQRNDSLAEKKGIKFYRPDQVDDIVSKLIDPRSTLNSLIKNETNHQLTFNDLTPDRLEHYRRSAD
jgi:hypothetical protein